MLLDVSDSGERPHSPPWPRRGVCSRQGGPVPIEDSARGLGQLARAAGFGAVQVIEDILGLFRFFPHPSPQMGSLFEHTTAKEGPFPQVPEGEGSGLTPPRNPAPYLCRLVNIL